MTFSQMLDATYTCQCCGEPFEVYGQECAGAFSPVSNDEETEWCEDCLYYVRRAEAMTRQHNAPREPGGPTQGAATTRSVNHGEHRRQAVCGVRG